MIIRSISIRSKLQLTTLVIVLLLALLALIYMDALKKTSITKELMQERTNLQSEYLALNQTFQRIVLNNESGQIASLISQVHKMEEQLRLVLNNDAVAGMDQLDRKTGQIYLSLDRLADNLRKSELSDSSRWASALIEMELLVGFMTEFDRFISEIQENSERKNSTQLGLSLLLGILLIASYMVSFAINLTGSFRKLASYARELKKGKLPLQLEYHSEDEFSQIASNLNSHTQDLRKKISYINSLAEEGPGAIVKPEDQDELGNALVLLSDVLIRKELEEATRNREDKKRNWISEGMAQVSEILRSERESVSELSYLIIQKLITYMNLEMGSLFITNNNDPQNPSLDLIASYAYDRRKYLHKNLAWGAGLPGTCAQEKEKIFLTAVPEDYFEVTSGTGAAIPNCLLLVPLKIHDVVHGVLELATMRLLRPFEIEFVESLCESITSSLLAVRNSERTTELLKQSQIQSEVLKSHEVAMQDNMKQLEKAQEESLKKETEITGILNAINQSSLVAELGPSGRFSSINDQFLMLLESPRDQIVGKLHSEFAQVDPYSEEYKEFWTSLREGRSKANVECYKLFSGKEIWLKQTFTPIINNEGKVYKILNIATDITETRALQEQLETRKQEITRSGLEMKTLNDAVNTALIKCELDADGIIMDVNENYTNVTGYGRKELLGRNYRLFLKDTEKEQFEKIFQEVIKEKVYEGVIRRSKPTGEEVWLVSTFSPVKDEAGNIYKIYFMGLDITEKKLKYQLLEDANQEIERLKEQLKDFEA